MKTTVIIDWIEEQFLRKTYCIVSIYARVANVIYKVTTVPIVLHRINVFLLLKSM